MFYMIGYIFAGLLCILLAGLGIGFAVDTIKDKRDKRPDIYSGGTIEIKIDDNDYEYYEVNGTGLDLTNAKSIKTLSLHKVSEDEMHRIVLAHDWKDEQ